MNKNKQTKLLWREGIFGVPQPREARRKEKSKLARARKVSVTKKQNIGSDTGKNSSAYQCVPHSDKELFLPQRRLSNIAWQEREGGGRQA